VDEPLDVLREPLLLLATGGVERREVELLAEDRRVDEGAALRFAEALDARLQELAEVGAGRLRARGGRSTIASRRRGRGPDR